MDRQPVIFLEGKRLYLRPIEKTDLERCQRWINDPEIRQYLLNSLPFDAEAEQRWHDGRDRGLLRSEITLAIVLKDGDRHIGSMGLHGIDWKNRRATTGALIGDKDCQGKGYGHEAKELLLDYAFNTLGLHRVNSVVLETNPRSLACLKKSGYVVEGKRRQAIFANGKWIDEVMLGVLADEWRARKKQ